MASTRRWALLVLVAGCLGLAPGACRAAAAEPTDDEAERLVARIVQKGKAERSTFDPMHGGLTVLAPEGADEWFAGEYFTWLLDRWEPYATDLEKKDPDLKALRAAGGRAAAAINKILPTVEPKDRAASELAWALGH
ncbi:MAG: hypothetical protein WBF17_27385, partial [Phycisphaerae bacterium]